MAIYYLKKASKTGAFFVLLQKDKGIEGSVLNFFKNNGLY